MHDVVTMGDAARLLGVGTSSLRDWADSGAVRCERTGGGHRRFQVHDLADWLERHGGHLPASEPRAMVDGRVPADTEVAMLLRRRQAVVAGQALALFEAAGTHPARGAARREDAVRDALVAMRQGIGSGDLRVACHRGAWLGYCAAVLGRSSRDVLGPVLAVGRTAARAVTAASDARRAQVVELATDRWAVAIADGYAAGLRPLPGRGPSPGDAHGTRWLGLADAAASLGVSRSTLREWCATTDVPHMRTEGGHRRFDPSELREWVAGQPDVLSRRRGTWPTVPRNAAAAEFVGRRGADVVHLAGLDVVRGHAWVSAATDALASGSLARARALSSVGLGVRDMLAMERAMALAVGSVDHDMQRSLQLALTAASQALVVVATDSA